MSLYIFAKNMKINKNFLYNSVRYVANYTRELDPTRPVTAAIAVPSQDDKAVRVFFYLHTYIHTYLKNVNDKFNISRPNI